MYTLAKYVTFSTSAVCYVPQMRIYPVPTPEGIRENLPYNVFYSSVKKVLDCPVICLMDLKCVWIFNHMYVSGNKLRRSWARRLQQSLLRHFLIFKLFLQVKILRKNGPK